MTGAPIAREETLADPPALATRVADWLLAAATGTEGVFALALSGGATPRLLYEQLAGPRLRAAFPWSRSHWFWGDERFVPHQDTRSNYRMVSKALLAQTPIPEANLHPIRTEGVDPEAAAAAYQRELQAFYGGATLEPARALFDVTLLGLGLDGHTASLFPGSAVLAERERWVAAVAVAGLEPRITLTYPALESSRRVAFLVAGPEKRGILERFRRRDESLPAVRLNPVGEIFLFMDAAAADAPGTP